MKTHKVAQSSKKTFNIKKLTIAVGTGLVALLSAQAMANDDYEYKTIGDLEVYQSNTKGSAVVSLMLDTSGSMGVYNTSNGGIDSVEEDYGVRCLGTTNRKMFKYTVPFTDKDGNPVAGTPTVTAYLHGCGRTNDINSDSTYLDRMSRLKKALIDVFADGKILSPEHKIGAGNYAALGNAMSLDNNRGALQAGRMVVPANKLTPEHRLELIKYVKSLKANSATPTAAAYAEVGAYMMGTTTASGSGPMLTRYVPVGFLKKTNTNPRQWTPSYCGYMSPVNQTFTVGSKTWLGCGAGTPMRALFDGVAMPLPSDPTNLIEWVKELFGEPVQVQDQRGLETTMTDTRNPADRILYGEKITADFGNLERHVGFQFSTDNTKKADRRTYQSPIAANGSTAGSTTSGTASEAEECDGYGIFFLTDGFPNSIYPNDIYKVMSRTLNGKPVNRTSDLQLQGSQQWNSASTWGYAAWDYIGGYARALRNPNNPSGKEIKTATVGFGAVFTDSPYLDKATGKIKDDDVANCDLLYVPRNYSIKLNGYSDGARLCKWGLDPNLGDGGFTATSDAKIVGSAFTSFVEELGLSPDTSPAGTISIPKDPLSIDNLQPYAYLPILNPAITSSVATWEGNLRKYHTLHGTLYGQNKQRLYQKGANATNQNADFPFDINVAVKDIWQKSANGSAKDVKVGGTREQLKAPATGSVRTVYVEVKENGKKPKMVKVGISASRRLVGFNQLVNYTIEDKLYLANFLGYDVGTDTTGISGDSDIETKLKTANFREPVLGGVAHSVPVLAAYQGEFDTTTGNITSDEAKREDYLLYGSMDGALHMVDARTGGETFAFIPRAIFDNPGQRAALLGASAAGVKGQPEFGVDAPWSVHASYNYDFKNDPSKADTMQATKMSAYGGLRMGGVGFYGLNLDNRNAPSLKFSISKGNDNKGNDFSRLGQTWSRPTPVTVKTGPRASDRRNVLVFGGGYDMCYEDPRFKLNDPNSKQDDCKNKKMADGNAVYMVDAEDGQLLAHWTAPVSGSGVGSDDDKASMVHSVVGGITVLDANNNGAVDHLYFSDLGGQIFRIDLKEGVEPSDSSFTHRLVKVFDANAGSDIKAKTDHVNYRFYEQPIVSFAEHGGVRFAVVNIASGDRSSPLYAKRKVEDANRIYGIYDRDLTSVRLLNSNLPKSDLFTKDLNSDKLQKIDPKAVENGKETTIKPILETLQKAVLSTNASDDVKHGWYYDMVLFDGYNNVPNLKTVGPGLVTGNIYYTSIYSPDYSYTDVSSCKAKVNGGTERQMFCLPWGICANSKTGRMTDGSINGILGYIKGGPGIQELAQGTITDSEGKSSRFRTVIGQQSIAEVHKEANKRQGSAPDAAGSAFGKTEGNKGMTFGAGSGGNLHSDGPKVAKDKRLRVERWYDLQNAEN